MTITLANRSEQIEFNKAGIASLTTDLSIKTSDLAKFEAQKVCEDKVAQAIEGKLFKLDPALVGKARSESRFKFVRVLHSVYYAITSLFYSKTINSLKTELKHQQILIQHIDEAISEKKTPISQIKAQIEELKSINRDLEQKIQDIGSARKTIAKTALGFAAAATSTAYAPLIAKTCKDAASSIPASLRFVQGTAAKVGPAFLSGLSNVNLKPALPYVAFAGLSAAACYALAKRHEARTKEAEGLVPTEAELALEEAKRKETQEKMSKALIISTASAAIVLNRAPIARAASKVAEVAVAGASRIGFGGALFIAGAVLATYVLKVRHDARASEALETA
jgi:hypothetical protein